MLSNYHGNKMCFSLSASISCPEFFQCFRSGQCLLWEQVCDGTEHCLLGDDEINCGKFSAALACILLITLVIPMFVSTVYSVLSRDP